MNNKNTVFILLVIALLMIWRTICFAVDGQELVEAIVGSNISVKRHLYLSSGVETGFKYSLEIPADIFNKNGIDIQYGQIMINGEPYSLEIRLNGETISNGSNIAATEDKKIYYQDISTRNMTGDETMNSLEVLLVPSNYSSASNTYSAMVTGRKEKLIIDPEDDGRKVSETEATSFWKAFWGIAFGGIFGDFNDSISYLTQAFCRMLIPLGDSFLHMISIAVGEPVTIDKVVYNEMTKLDANFFDTSSDYPYQKPLKNIMAGVVNSWYDVFRGITIVVLMILLVYIGIKILILSTAEKNAAYKSVFSSWVMAVAMLMFFPYVMKYIILLNNGFCTWIGGQASKFYSGGSLSGEAVDQINQMGSVDAMYGTYGKDEFIMKVLGRSEPTKDFVNTAIRENKFGTNIMMRLRFIADKKLDVPLTIIYLILIGQLLALLVIYYKRVFMIAFLITIFPLVVILYPLKKIGDIKADSFGVWFKEFIVNVVIQAFHAVTYTVVVLIGVNSYLENDNWLFMILCVLFLFEGEKVIRGIFGITSSAKSIGDLAMSGAMAFAALKSVGGIAGSAGGAATKVAAKGAAKGYRAGRNALNNKTRSAQKATEAEAMAQGDPTTVTVTEVDNAANIEVEKTNYQPHYYKQPEDLNDVKNRVDSYGKDSKKRKAIKGLSKLTGGAVKFTSQVAFATLGTTYGLATGGLKEAVITGEAGRKLGGKIGGAGSGIIQGIAGKALNITAARHVANEYLSGEHDDEIGITEAMAQADKARANAIREVYARAARRGGSKRAEIKFIKDSLDQK